MNYYLIKIFHQVKSLFMKYYLIYFNQLMKKIHLTNNSLKNHQIKINHQLKSLFKY